MLSGLFVGKRPEERLFEPPSMDLFDGHRGRRKPHGGLWTCPEMELGRSAWIDWCMAEGCQKWIRHKRLWRVVAAEPRVYVIDSFRDLKRALKRWPHRPYADTDIPSLRREREIHYVAMAEEYDAVYLTEEGQWATRLTFPDNLYGWDVPSILWLRWVFDRVEPVRRLKAA